MKIFGKSENSSQNGSLWSRLTKQQKKQDKKHSTRINSECTSVNSAIASCTTISATKNISPISLPNSNIITTATKSTTASNHQQLDQTSSQSSSWWIYNSNNNSNNNTTTKNNYQQNSQSHITDDINSATPIGISNSVLASPSTPHSRKDSNHFRLSLQSLKPAKSTQIQYNTSTGNSVPFGSNNNTQSYRSSIAGPEFADSRLRTSKLQCEQLKKKVATISLECQKLEDQCKELKEVKDQLVVFQSDILMLKRKDKVSAEIQMRINHLDEENYQMRQHIDKLRSKVKEISIHWDPDIINKRLDNLETENNQLTSITIQNRRNHEAFSLDVGNQLVETFITQQTIYEEFRRLQHRLISVERQNQIMADLIHFHCHNSSRSNPIMTNSGLSSHGQLSLSISPPSYSDRENDKVNSSPNNFDWHLSDQPDCAYQSHSLSKKMTMENPNLNEYYKIDFSPNHESMSTLNQVEQPSNEIVNCNELRSTSTVLSSHHVDSTTKCLDIHNFDLSTTTTSNSIQNPSSSSTSMSHNFTTTQVNSTTPHSGNKFIFKTNSPISQRDDGYYSASTNRTMMASCLDESQITMTTTTTTTPSAALMTSNDNSSIQTRYIPSFNFRDKKQRYFILPFHPQKSKGKSLHCCPPSQVLQSSGLQSHIISSPQLLLVKQSRDLEMSLFNRKLRQRQHKQRECTINSIKRHDLNNTKNRDNKTDLDDDLDDECCVFSDTELYGTRFCIDSDLDEDDDDNITKNQLLNSYRQPLIGFGNPRTKFGFNPSNTKKMMDTRLMSSLPPLIENASTLSNNGERKIQIRSVALPQYSPGSSSSGSSSASVSSPAHRRSKIIPPKVRPRSIATTTLTQPSSSPLPPTPQQSQYTNDDDIFINNKSKFQRHKSPQKPPLQKKSLKNSENQNSFHKSGHIIDRCPPPPIPPRPKRYNQSVEMLPKPSDTEYINDPNPPRLSPDGCQAPVTMPITRNNDGDNIHQSDEEDPYYDPDFVSQLDKYQLPNSCVNMLVMQHFK